MDVLLLGVDASTSAALAEVFAHLDLTRVGRADRWSEISPEARYQVVFVGEAAVEPAWAPFEARLRREVNGASLIAVADSEALGAWDDVVRGGERDAGTLERVTRFALRLAGAQDQLARWALRDPLTDVLNRRGLEQVLSREGSSRDRGKGPLSVILVDVDDFKQVNDALGMAGGDRVLHDIAAALRQSVRKGDAVARVGGDEFLVLLPGARTWEAVEVAERIRRAVGGICAEDQPVTVSMGVRRLSPQARTLEELLTATQSGLKISKSSGKNQVHIASSSSGASTSLSDAQSLPPHVPLQRFVDRPLVRLAGDEPAALLRSTDTSPELSLQLAMQRAVQPAWDVFWFRAASRARPRPAHQIHLRLYPATVAQVAADEIVGRLPFEPQQLWVALDEQFLSGDLVGLPEGMASLRARGCRFCLDVSEIGQACVESLVLLRPERVLLTAEILAAAVGVRSRRAALLRFGKVVQALGLELVVDGVDSPSALDLAHELGVRRASGPVVAG